MDSAPKCPFCLYEGPNRILADFGDVYVVAPLREVTPGHVLVIPKEHVADLAHNPFVTGRTFEVAAILAREIGGDVNLITSKGHAATQTVRHLHVHVLPRHEGDGLVLPWTEHQREQAELASPALTRLDDDGVLLSREGDDE